MPISKEEIGSKSLTWYGWYFERYHLSKLGPAYDRMQYLTKSWDFIVKHDQHNHIWAHITIRDRKPTFTALLHLYQWPEAWSQPDEVKVSTVLWRFPQQNHQIRNFIPRSELEDHDIPRFAQHLRSRPSPNKASLWANFIVWKNNINRRMGRLEWKRWRKRYWQDVQHETHQWLSWEIVRVNFWKHCLRHDACKRQSWSTFSPDQAMNIYYLPLIIFFNSIRIVNR